MLLVGLLRARVAREVLVPVLTLASFGTAIGLRHLAVGERVDLIAGAMRLDDLTLVADVHLLRRRHRGGPAVVAQRGGRARPAHGEFYALLLTSIAGMVVLVAAQNLVALFLGLELLSIPLYVLCATEMRRATLARVGPEVPDHRLGRLGDAALRPGAHLRRDGLDGLRRDRGQGRRRRERRRAAS